MLKRRVAPHLIALSRLPYRLLAIATAPPHQQRLFLPSRLGRGMLPFLELGA